jgi:hypothetical protein
MKLNAEPAVGDVISPHPAVCRRAIDFRNPSHPSGAAVEIVGCLNTLLGEQAYPHNVREV